MFVQQIALEDRYHLLLEKRAGMFTVHYKRFSFPTSRFLFYAKVSFGAAHVALWQSGFRELAQENADAMATAIALSSARIKFFVSNPEVLLL